MSYKIYTDGACSYNPGPGGAGAVVQLTETLTYMMYEDLTFDTNRIAVCYAEEETTNQRMEIKGITIGLKLLNNYLDKKEKEINIYSDSAYCVNAFNQHWLEKWEENGWVNSKKEAVKNQTYWKELLNIYKDYIKNGYTINFIKVKGHSGIIDNELVDGLARNAGALIESEKLLYKDMPLYFG